MSTTSNSLSDKLQMTMRRLTGRGKLDEKDIEEMMREVRLSLLEADVNFKIVKSFTQSVKEQALGEKILKGLNPGQQVVKIVHDELKKVMGDEAEGIRFKINGMTTIMTIGLQGSGKTTAIGKMAVWLRKKEKKKVLMIAADVYRPAAIQQLQTIGKQVDIDVYQEGLIDARTIVKNGLKYASENKYDVVIVDTAGRLNIDEEMMQELKDVKEIVKPDEILLTVDAMMGQEAANVAKSFHDQIGATGAILTKMDGDTRGGAALSIREISNIPIKFSSAGEKMDSLEAFHPERMASRILGMGDMLTFIEQVTDNIDEDEAKNMMEKLMTDDFNYNDLMKQFKMIKRMGSMSKLLGFIPGLGAKLKQARTAIDDKQFDKMEVIIKSMTEEERKNPKLVDQSSKRRERIAKGSGTAVSDVNKLKEALETQKKMFKKMASMDEKELERLQKDPSSLMNQAPQPKKGKGKGKGGFRY
ncbi:Signal recognition particle GTPase [Alteracholeplasma palmae J233]|uniref:Signal recognition particle protein n=1 Tax=Alteracholeplasma palmae (strain ATCC 49389 / J233) TaxID=1318466 RepID=U4KPA8_ALTPJ|nr:signal recognition particle protein [Alteracholeplasma palmae]CCV64055.1 Signal recognition particle GTPase [Alteracholeplasma palmae J233]